MNTGGELNLGLLYSPFLWIEMLGSPSMLLQSCSRWNSDLSGDVAFSASLSRHRFIFS